MEKIVIIIGVLLVAGFFSCKNRNNMKKYKWAAGICAPREYPVRVYQGDFYSDDFWASIPNGGIMETGWGKSSMEMGKSTIIPKRFKITWLSFVENKFYTGEGQLPFERIEALFKEGFYDDYTKEKMTYNSISVGMAPGGCIVVWMIGVHKAVEIGRYQAEETDVEWDLFLPTGIKDRNVYVANVLSRRPKTLEIMKEGRIDYKIWDTYRKKYNWRLKVILPERSRIEIFYLWMYNGEYEQLFDKKLEENTFSKKAVPRTIAIHWYDKEGKKYGTEYDFNEQEVIKAYKEIYRDDPDQECELVIEADNKNLKSMSVYLRSKTEEIELRGSRSYGSYTMRQRNKD